MYQTVYQREYFQCRNYREHYYYLINSNRRELLCARYCANNLIISGSSFLIHTTREVGTVMKDG